MASQWQQPCTVAVHACLHAEVWHPRDHVTHFTAAVSTSLRPHPDVDTFFFTAPTTSKVTFCHRVHHWGEHNFCDLLAVSASFLLRASFSEWHTHCAKVHRLQCSRCGAITWIQPVSHSINVFDTTYFPADELIKSEFQLLSN